MSETNLNILVKVAGESELNELIDKIRDGNASIDEQTRAIKILDSVYKSWGKENEKLKEGVAATSRAIKDMRTQELEPLKGAASRAKDEYFDLGTKLRRFYMEQRVGDRTMREVAMTAQQVGGALGATGLGGALNTVFAGWQQVEFATTAAGLGAEHAGGKFAGLGARLLDIVPAAAGAGAAIMAVMYAANEAAKITERFNQSLKDLYETNVKAGKISKESQVAILTKQINELRQKPLDGPSTMAQLLGPAKVAEERAAMAIERQKQIADLEGQRKKLEEELTTEFEKQNKEKEKSVEKSEREAEEAKRKAEAAEEERGKRAALQAKAEGDASILVRYLEGRLATETGITKQLELQVALNDALKTQYQQQAPGARPEFSSIGAKASQFGVGKPGQSKTVGGMVIGDPVKKMEDVKVAADVTFSDIMSQTQALEQSFSGAADSIASMVGGTIGGAFRDMFGGANSLLGSFVGTFMSSIASMAANVVTSGLLNSLIPGLGLLGGFKLFANGGQVSEGRAVIVGERGPEIFVPRSSGEVVSNMKASRMESAPMSSEPIVLETRLRGTDIVLVQARASRGRRGRTM